MNLFISPSFSPCLILERKCQTLYKKLLCQAFVFGITRPFFSWLNIFAFLRFFENFLRKHDPTTADTNQEFPTEGPRRKRTQTIYQALRAQFIDVGCLRHDRSGPSPEMVRLVLWSSCLPYVCPERELSICLLMTNINIYLFHSPHLDSPEVARALTEVNDLLPVLKCFYSFPVREMGEVS